MPTRSPTVCKPGRQGGVAPWCPPAADPRETLPPPPPQRAGPARAWALSPSSGQTRNCRPRACQGLPDPGQDRIRCDRWPWPPPGLWTRSAQCRARVGWFLARDMPEQAPSTPRPRPGLTQPGKGPSRLPRSSAALMGQTRGTRAQRSARHVQASSHSAPPDCPPHSVWLSPSHPRSLHGPSLLLWGRGLVAPCRPALLHASLCSSEPLPPGAFATPPGPHAPSGAHC